MNNTELAIKFSNEKYCTKKDVVETLKTPLIDSIWNSVLEYRASFSHPIGLKHISNVPYQICLTPTMVEHINSVERKLSTIDKTYFKMNGFVEQEIFRTNSYVKILKRIANKYSLNVNDETIKNIVEGNVSALSPDLLILNRYLQCLLEIERTQGQSVTLDTIAKFNSLLLGSEELLKDYRTTDIDNSLSRVVIGKLYLGVPANAISKNMDQFFAFVEDSSVSMFIKAISSLYFIYYVRPFDSYSEELATLTMKKVLAANDLGDVASLIDFEALLDDKETLEQFIFESQKTLDLTYLLDYIIKKCESYINSVCDQIVQVQASVIRSEIHQPEETNILNNIQNLDRRAQTINIQQPQFEQKPSPIETRNTGAYTGTVNYSQSIAISNVPTGLSEEEAFSLENHLMELNPNLTRGQAYFYARHCTLGMSYTISQYKRVLGCAYETARTSMDNLVALGYYRKEILRNKYIYTPVKKG